MAEKLYLHDRDACRSASSQLRTLAPVESTLVADHFKLPASILKRLLSLEMITLLDRILTMSFDPRFHLSLDVR